MSKGGVYKITGNKNPKIGEKTFYNVVEWYRETPHSQRNQSLVTWELFVKEGNSYRSTGIKKKGVNYFTFGPNAHKFSYKVEGYLHEAEGKEPMAIFVQPKKNENSTSTEKEILGVNLTYQDGSKITKTLNYMDRLRANAKCQNLALHSIVFKLWEDDEADKGHNSKNQFIAKSLPRIVDNKGNARWDFTLFNTYIALANKREDEKKKHEYYVTAEYVGKYKTSGNVNVNNPDTGKTPTPNKPKKDTHHSLPTRTPTKKPQPKPTSPKASTKSSSKNNQADVKGYVKSVKITDKNGNAFSTNPKFGDTVKIIIDAIDVEGLDYNLRIWESDYFGKHDILYNEVHTFKNDLQYVLCTLTDKMRIAGEIGNDPINPDSGEYTTGNYQEIFAEIVFMHASSKSSNIDVGLNAQQKKQVSGKSPAIKKKEDVPENKDSCVCKDEYKLIWGNKISCAERKKVVEVCKNIWGESSKIEKAKELMAIIHLESANSFSPSKVGVNKKGTKYIGLIQFSETTAKSLGTTYSALGKMSFVVQMDYVQKYLEKNKDEMKTLVDFYLQVLNPAAVGKGSDPTYKVFDESISVPDGDGSGTSEKQRNINITIDPWVKKYGYASNPPFMKGDEHKTRKKWVYTRQRFEDRYGYENGNTTIKEIDDVVRNDHYNPGKAEIYVGKCEDKPIERKENDGKRAPWVDVAFEEFEKFKGKTEIESPLKERVAEYFKLSGFPSLDHTDSWCATFIFWCFQHTEDYKDTNVSGNVGAFDWGEENNSKVINNASKDGWILGEQSEVFVGAIIVFTFSHVAIIVGENSIGDSYVYLGANQGSKITGGQKICFGSVLKTNKSIYMIMKPKKYIISDQEKILPKYDVNSENSNASSR